MFNLLSFCNIGFSIFGIKEHNQIWRHEIHTSAIRFLRMQYMHSYRLACTRKLFHSFPSLFDSLFLQWLTSWWVMSMQLETFTGDKIHWNENCCELLRKHSTRQGAAAALPWQRWREHEVLESESQGYSIYSCFNNTTQLWKEYYISCKYDENTYQIFPARVLVQWTERTCHQG